ncbi:MAG: valine--tRNA ligase [Patescibacteria group bacterium]|nr:valine--tRNA ligase [Patescibacteria group bacterium]
MRRTGLNLTDSVKRYLQKGMRFWTQKKVLKSKRSKEKNMTKIIPKAYEPEKFEDSIYQDWEKSGYFKPEINPEGKPFTIIMPPPNANGSLHIGHAVFISLEDLMIRHARLLGKKALWLPGADHAGFETQVVFEKKLEKEGKSRFKIEREKLYQMMYDFTQENKKVMENQLRKLGASCDWDREKFTLNEDIKKIVYRTFKKLYEDGLAYRSFRSINWCTKHQTSLSDLEVKYEERKDPLYYIKYELVNKKEKYLILATVRPETLFGDVAVAVNSKDKRYKDLVGQKVKLPLTDQEIPIIIDDHVDPKFGTGVVKITPAHDPNDFEIGLRHDLEVVEVIDKYGKMNEKTGPYNGLKIVEARAMVVEDLKKKDLIEKIDEDYTHTVGVCYKCSTVIEPRVLPQWFIAINKKGKKSGKNLAADAIKAVKDHKTEFVTEKFEKIFNHWMKNIRDWNISRQIVWGIQLPVWYCQNCNEVVVTEGEKPSVCPGCKDKNIIQDIDVFDTWFSSGQWPFATLQTTGVKDDFETFYPTSVMETGWDILFFWVARMIMLGLYETEEVPFKKVYMHGLVRDKDRAKMSKSKGNVINPLGVAELYGTDAVRMSLIFGTSAGNDAIISEEKIRGMRNFVNKIWNASRFVMLRVSEGNIQTGELGEAIIDNLNVNEKILPSADKNILKKHEVIKKSVSKKLDEFMFSQAAEEIYEFFWHEFCDVYIEAAKGQLNPEMDHGQNEPRKENTKKILIEILSETLIMLHPFVPFVTEAVWQELRKLYPNLSKSIMIARWPK